MTPAELAALHAAAFTTPRPWSEAEFASLLSDPHCFLVTQAGAFALGRVIADEAELLTIATPPSLRRRGLGRACLTGFDTAARARNARQAFLEVAANNAAAIALYLGNGWTISGKRPGYYRAPDGSRVDAQILGKPLA
ncbi:GNAT family N-acetyltransferase [Pseudooceanicola sp.]|uniref:GNAT family N-acetyltransferase n=1 Tax=Pseudooceanicola sp. TaxID=1914328 RepID=UPI0035C6C6A1